MLLSFASKMRNTTTGVGLHTPRPSNANERGACDHGGKQRPSISARTSHRSFVVVAKIESVVKAQGSNNSGVEYSIPQEKKCNKNNTRDD